MKEYFSNIWVGLSTIAIGMKVTFKHLFVPAVTIQYPNVRVELPERERNRLYVNMDDCIGCDQRSRACPVSCIEIETVKGLPTEDLGKTSNGKKKAAKKAAKKPVTPAAEIKAEVKVKTEAPPLRSDNSQQSNLKEPGENK